MNETGTPVARVLRAAVFAADRHRDQRRKGESAPPYVNHPLQVAHVLAEQGGVTDPDVLCAALLHDTVEDTATTADELESAFGPAVTAMVLEVTDDKSLEKLERKAAQIEHAPHLSPGAKLVKLADKICNLRDVLASPPAGWSLERRQAYFEWAGRVVAGVRGTNAPLETLFDGLMQRRSELR